MFNSHNDTSNIMKMIVNALMGKFFGKKFGTKQYPVNESAIAQIAKICIIISFSICKVKIVDSC